MLPETNKIMSCGREGKLANEESAIIKDPDIAVIDVPLLPEIVPTRAMGLPHRVSIYETGRFLHSFEFVNIKFVVFDRFDGRL